MIGWVAIVAALLLAASRGAFRLVGTSRGNGGPGREAGREVQAGTPAEAGIPALPAPDLTFYQALGRSQGAPGVRIVPGSGGGAPGVSGGDDPAAGGAYVVQALATRDGAAAGRLRSRLRARGLPAVLSEERVGDRVVYRVRVGRYRDRAVAEIVARRLREREGLDPWVLREAG